MIKLSEVYVEDERIAYKPADTPGGIPKHVHETYRRYLPVTTVTGWARFSHYFLDAICYYLLIIVASAAIVIATGDESFLDSSAASVFNLALIVLYYFFFESVMQTTPGKLATKSVVVDEYGRKPNTSQLLGRSFARLVPFEAFSCLGDPSRGWHDSWSDTYVMRKKDLNELLDRISEMEGESRHVYNSLISEQ